MEPTLKVGDRVLVNKLSYHLHDVHRGDIVVFERPPGETGDRGDQGPHQAGHRPARRDRSRRSDGQVYINGQPLDEPYLPDGKLTDRPASTPARSRQDQYFVMGDNRGNSKDSRVFGPIPKSLIVGRAFVRVWPLTDIGLL